jgi:cytochrome c peroxidase
VKGIYSDLLLHDLGPGLADPVPAAPGFFAYAERPLPPGTPEPSQQQQPQQFPQGYYGGGSSLAGLLGLSNSVQFAVDPKTGVRSEFRALRTVVEQEWRTPPLWGVADSAPYLHDGRAATLIDAIVLHGGEADPCIQRFAELPVTERFAVMEFLNSLRAPEGL